MNEFLGLMLDPFVAGRFGSGGGIGGGLAMGFAPEEVASLPPDVALAYAGVLKAPPSTPFEQRWTTWGAAYGGANLTNGDFAVGSSNLSAQTYGFAAGMDYHYSPDTIFGFALGGGGTNWGLAGGGTGRSDAFQTGVYGITRSGPAYLAAALAFANHWMTTNRGALGDELTANFDAQSYGARLEGGYRYTVLPTLGVTPYAALQAQDFHTPNYSETDVTGGGFGLSYAAMNATDVVHLSWEVIRYRNLTTELIGATQQQALERVLRMLIYGNLERQPPDGDPFLLMNRSQKLAHEYVLKIEDAAEEVEDLLKTAGLTMESVQAEAFAMRSTDIELLQRLSASAEYRRNSAIQQIERRRSYFAERLRTAVNQIEDAEFRVIEHKSADQRKAA